MPSNAYPRMRLDEVVEVAAGNPAPQELADFSDEGMPFIRMQDVGRAHHTSNLVNSTDKVSDDAITRHRLRLFPAGSVLIPKSGASVNLNHRAMLGRATYVVSHLAVLVPNHQRILPEYLYFWSLSYDPRNQAQTTSLPSLPLSLIKAAEIPVPPLSEQHRIVDILSRAEGIVRLRRDAQQKAAELLPGIFIDMFGDPAINPKGWPIVTLGSLLAEPPTLGTMTKPSPTEGKWLDLRVANIQGGKLRLDDKKWVDLPREQIGRFALRAGDIVLARAIGSLDHLGKAVVVYPDSDWTFDSHLMRVRLDGMRLLSEVFKGFLESKSGRDEFLKHTRQSAVQFNINGKELRAIQIFLPPIALQREYLAHTEGVQSILSQQSAATAKAEATFAALLAQVFTQ